jgi:hypothetical protein
MKSPHPPSKSRLKKPEPKILGERRLYPGSLSSIHTELSDQQRGEALTQLKTAILPSDIVISGRSAYDPHTAETLRRFVSGLLDDGLVEQVKTGGFRLTERGLKERGQAPQAE